MTILRLITGLFAIFLITLFPVIVRSEDICEESTDRVESYLTSFVDKVAAGGLIEDKGLKKLIFSLSREPDIYEVDVEASVRFIVPGGGEFFVNVDSERIRAITEGGDVLRLSEGDIVRVSATVTEPSAFSRLTGRYGSPAEREASRVSRGCRIGRTGIG